MNRENIIVEFVEKIGSFFNKQDKKEKEEEIIKSIREESSQRLQIWFEQNKDSIQQKLEEFDNPIKGFECIVLKKLIGILTKMEIENKRESIEWDAPYYKKLMVALKSELSINENK